MAVFFYDLLRGSRRGRLAALRAGYALALLIALASLFARRFPGALSLNPTALPWTQTTINELASFAAHFAATCLFVQFGAVLLLTPALTAGAIAEERQRGTLDLLLSSGLSAVEIVLGKLLARTLVLFMLLLTGLPVLFLTQLWGGVDEQFLLAGFAVNVLTLLSVGAVGLFCSALARTVPGAVFGTYVLTGLFGLATLGVPGARWVNPVALFNEWLDLLRNGAPVSNWLRQTLGLAAFHGPAAGLLVLAAAGTLRDHGRALSLAEVRAAVRRLRSAGVRRDFEALAALVTPLLRRPVITVLPRAATVRVFPPPPVHGDGLLWKELHFGGHNTAGELFRSAGCLVLLIEVVVALPVILILIEAGAERTVAWEVNPFLSILLVDIFAAVALGAAVFAACSISSERERQTLDGLLTTPGGRLAVLRAKWLGSLLRVRWLALGLVPACGLALITGAFHPLLLPWLMAVGFVHVAFAVSLGLWLSARAHSTGRAALASLIIILGLCFLPSLVSGSVADLWTTATGIPAPLPVVQYASPTWVWWLLTRPGNSLLADGSRPILIASAAYAVAALLLLALAYRRFGREGTHGHGR